MIKYTYRKYPLSWWPDVTAIGGQLDRYRQSFSIQVMCQLFSVTRSSYYSWVNNGCIVEKIDKPFNAQLQQLFEEARGTYGTRRLKVILEKRYGIIVSRRKIQNSLQQLNLKVKMKRRYKVIMQKTEQTGHQ